MRAAKKNKEIKVCKGKNLIFMKKKKKELFFEIKE